MKLKSMSKEEIEQLSYTDLTYMLLKENKTSMSTKDIFKKICELLDYSDEDYSNKIGDFYTSLTIDKRFIMLENSEWDLREKHAVELDMDEDEDEEPIEETEEENEEELEEDIDNIDNDDVDDVDDEDDMDDLSIVDEEDIEDEQM